MQYIFGFIMDRLSADFYAIRSVYFEGGFPLPLIIIIRGRLFVSSIFAKYFCDFFIKIALIFEHFVND